MLLDFFLSPWTGGLLLGSVALAGCSLDFDRFTPISLSPTEDGSDPGPNLEAGRMDDVVTVPPIEGSTDIDAAPIADAGSVAPTDATAPTDAGACSEARSVSFGGHCYFPLTSRGSWTAASTSCQASGAHLVTIGSAEEQTAVVAIAVTQDRWMGLTRPANALPTAGSYAWITGEAFGYAHWGNGEPNFTGECVRMVQAGTWADNPCTTSYNAICERETP